MDKFEEVSTDVIKEIAKMKYEDKEKQLLLSNILYNMGCLLKNEESYNSNINILVKKQKKQLKY